MKISRLEIENFAIDESPTINEPFVAGKDLLLYGGNRSGKTLVFNAILYGLYGRGETFGVSPGQRCKLDMRFDNSDAVIRERDHQYEHDGERLDANTGVKRYVGWEDTVRLQFIASNPLNQPISSLRSDELLDRIRSVIDSEKQCEIERHRRANAELEHLREIRRRGEDRPSIEQLENDLDSLPISGTKERIEEIEELQDLIESREIESIRDRLQKQDEVAERLDELYDRRREIEDSLKQKRNDLGDASRYTQEVDDLIIDAIQEFICPVCERLVEESTARNRLPNQCPQCGRPRDLTDLRGELREKVDTADTRIKNLKKEIADLEEELASVKAEITELKNSEPELSQLTRFVRTALKQAGYEIDQLEKRTYQELKNKKEDLSRFESQREELEKQLEKRRNLLAEIDEGIEEAERKVDKLEWKAHETIREEFAEEISAVYKDIAPDLGTDVGITSEGELELPGTGSEGRRGYGRLSSGERRLVNLAFAITLAKFAKQNDDAHNFEVLVLDEPLTNLESNIQDATARYLRNSDLQCILTSPLERIQSHFQDDEAEIIPLDRIKTEDTSLEEYI